MDLDHFFQARSLFLKDAVHLDHRPFMHSLPFAAFVVLSGVTLTSLFCYRSSRVVVWFLLGLSAIFSHQIRDAYRRGLWMGLPTRSTWSIPVPYLLYLSILALQAFLLYFLGKWRRTGAQTLKPRLAHVV
eukprot:m.61266 g.61266  ORF g.61266 m.61266 type:complete len:130 (-) comp13329_c1_seq2:1072-1461(-)